MSILSFFKKVEKWASKNDDIEALIVVGSYARGEARADSDIDLVIITTNPETYLSNNFFCDFGKVKEFKKEDWGRVTSLRVWYEDNGLEVEFGITTPIWAERPLDAGTFKVLSDGFRVIVDKVNYFQDIMNN